MGRHGRSLSRHERCLKSAFVVAVSIKTLPFFTNTCLCRVDIYGLINQVCARVLRLVKRRGFLRTQKFSLVLGVDTDTGTDWLKRFFCVDRNWPIVAAYALTDKPKRGNK